MILEVLVVFVFGIGLRAVFINTSSADSAIQQYMIERLKKKPFGDYTSNKSVISGMYAYPSLHYYIFTKIPHKIRIRIYKILNILLDSIMPSICIYLFSIVYDVFNLHQNVSTGLLLVGLIITTSPIFFPLSARLQGMGARVLGLLIFTILVIGWFFIEIDSNYGFIITFIGCFLAVSTSMFLLQVVISLMVFTLCIGYVEFSLSCFMSFIIMLLTNFGGTRDILQWKLDHWIWYFKVKELMLVVNKDKNKKIKYLLNSKKLIHNLYSFLRNTRNATYHTIGPKLFIDNFMAIPCIWYYFNLNLSTINDVGLSISYTVLFCMIMMYILTSFRPLRIFGQPDRYFEYSIMCQGYIVYYLFINGVLDINFLIILITLNIFLIGLNLSILFRPNKIKKQYNPDSLLEVAKFLDKQKRRVLVIPSKLGYEFACLTNNCQFWLPFIMEKRWWTAEKVGFSYMRKTSDSNYYDQHEDFTQTMSDYKLDTVVIRKDDLKKYNLNKFTKSSEFSDYSVFEYNT